MRIKVIEQFICSLQKEGLRFSVDTIAREFALTKHNYIRKKFQNTLPSSQQNITIFIIDSVLENLNGKPIPAELITKLEVIL